jgi:hypothetical protein
MSGSAVRLVTVIFPVAVAGLLLAACGGQRSTVSQSANAASSDSLVGVSTHAPDATATSATSIGSPADDGVAEEVALERANAELPAMTVGSDVGRSVVAARTSSGYEAAVFGTNKGGAVCVVITVNGLETGRACQPADSLRGLFTLVEAHPPDGSGGYVIAVTSADTSVSSPLGSCDSSDSASKGIDVRVTLCSAPAGVDVLPVAYSTADGVRLQVSEPVAP